MVGGSSILDEYQPNSRLDVASHAEFNDNHSNHQMFNDIGRNQINFINCRGIFVLLPRNTIRLLRIVLKLMIVWLVMNIRQTIVGAFK